MTSLCVITHGHVSMRVNPVPSRIGHACSHTIYDERISKFLFRVKFARTPDLEKSERLTKETTRLFTNFPFPFHSINNLSIPCSTIPKISILSTNCIKNRCPPRGKGGERTGDGGRGTRSVRIERFHAGPRATKINK